MVVAKCFEKFRVRQDVIDSEQVAAEDPTEYEALLTRVVGHYKPSGFEEEFWTEKIAVELWRLRRAADDLEGDRTRGASTITQQLVKNLFFGTGRSIVRKGAEATLVPVAEFVLGKKRILEIYLNVVEWGPWILWCRVGVSLLRCNRSPECRQARGGTASCNSAGSSEATTRANE
jgi:Transglycosylase